MNNSHQFDPFYSVKNPKLMTKEELRQHKKNVKRIKKRKLWLNASLSKLP